MKQRISGMLGVMAALLVPAAGQAVEAGAPAPSCKLAALDSSPALESGQLLGKVVYVDFWASWCVPCVWSFPFLNTLEHDLSSRGLVVLGVDVDENTGDASAFLQHHPARFAVGADPKGECPKAYGLHGMPTSYLVDRKGVVRYVHSGFRDGDRGELRRKIEQVLVEDGLGPVEPPAAGQDMDHMHMDHGAMNHEHEHPAGAGDTAGPR